MKSRLAAFFIGTLIALVPLMGVSAHSTNASPKYTINSGPTLVNHKPTPPKHPKHFSVKIVPFTMGTPGAPSGCSWHDKQDQSSGSTYSVKVSLYAAYHSDGSPCYAYYAFGHEATAANGYAGSLSIDVYSCNNSDWYEEADDSTVAGGLYGSHIDDNTPALDLNSAFDLGSQGEIIWQDAHGHFVEAYTNCYV